MDWLPPPIGSIKLNFNECSLDNLRWLDIGVVIRDHLGTVLRDYSKPTDAGSTIEVEMLALLEGLLQTKALSIQYNPKGTLCKITGYAK